MPERQMAELQQAPKETEVSNYAREQIHEAAVRGIQGTGTRLPHLNKIQASFGRHDVSGIKAFTDSAAVQATGAMHAEAYTFNKQVAFNNPNPSLHTAAHEAAHAIQQEGGVQLKGGIGEVGDPYERHADAVADQVVQGRSAEGLLDGYVRKSASSHTAVQMASKYDKAAPTGSKMEFTESGRFDALDGKHTMLYRAGEVEAVIIPGQPLAGSIPKGDILGWHWVHQFAGTKSSDAWMRFHILNHNLGGPGHAKKDLDAQKNLVPTRTASNKSSAWYYKFEAPTKEKVEAKSQPVHFYAKVDYYAATDGKPGDPGTPHLPFFPKNIIAHSSYWDGYHWRKINTAPGAGELKDIPKPPTNAAMVPVYLKTVKEASMNRHFSMIDPDLRRLVCDEKSRTKWKINELTVGSSLQDIYVALLDGIRIDRITTTENPAMWLSNRWNAFEAALKDTTVLRPLRLCDGWTATGTVDKAKAEAAIRAKYKPEEEIEDDDEKDEARKKEEARASAARVSQGVDALMSGGGGMGMAGGGMGIGGGGMGMGMGMGGGGINPLSYLGRPPGEVRSASSSSSSSLNSFASPSDSRSVNSSISSSGFSSGGVPRASAVRTEKKFIHDICADEMKILVDRKYGTDPKVKAKERIWYMWKKEREVFINKLASERVNFSSRKDFEHHIKTEVRNKFEELITLYSAIMEVLGPSGELP